MKPILSVVIPTLNRYNYLQRTLSVLITQVERNKNEVELVVCCNSSKDETDTYLQSLLPDYPFIRYKYFEEYVEVGQSLIRSANEALGEYIVIWGDDDIPHPFYIETILDIIKTNPGIGIIHCNRLAGKDTKFGFKDLKVEEDRIESDQQTIFTIEELVQRFGKSLGFISSLVFRRDDWNRGIPYYNDSYYGYEHLSIIINGSIGRKCYYCPYPVEIQRLPFDRDFLDKWPLYRFVGIPNMMSDFDNNGVTQNALECWQNKVNKSFPSFIWNMTYTSTNKKFFKPLCSELNKYQKSIIRKALTYVIVYTYPKWLFLFFKKRLYK